MILAAFALPFRSKGRLEAENAILRQQVIVLRRQVSAAESGRTESNISSLRMSSMSTLRVFTFSHDWGKGRAFLNNHFIF